MTDTTIRVSTTTRDRVRALGRGQRAEDVIIAALDELERRRRADAVREQSLAVSQDPDDLAEIKRVMEAMASARAW